MLASLLLALATAAGAPPTGANAAEAHALTVRSIREYNAGDFADALRDAKRAYELTGFAALLFNLGQCHRQLGHWQEAEFNYRGYLREKPDAANRQEVLDLIAMVQAKQKEAAAVVPAPAPTPAPAPVPIVVEAAPPTSPAPVAAVSEAPPKGGLPASTWWLGGSGAVLAVGGGVLGVLANLNGNNDSGVDHAVTGPNYVTGQYEGLTADVLWGVGGALIVAAIIVAATSH